MANHIVTGGIDVGIDTIYNFEYIEGSDFNDIITGSAGNEYLLGKQGADILNGLSGADNMTGGDGTDLYFVDNAGDLVTETNADSVTGGVDTIATTVSYTLGANLERMVIQGAGNINATGNELNNTLIGNDANNTLFGGLGKDTMVGGLGADTFTFNAINESLVGGSRDIITDFSGAQLDKINLSGIDAISGGANDAFTYIGTSAFSNVAGQLRFASGVVYGDVNGDSVSDFEIALTGVASMVAGDFVV